MKVLHLNYSNSSQGGGAVSSVLLHTKLLTMGIESKMIVQKRAPASDDVVSFPSGFPSKSLLTRNLISFRKKFLRFTHRLPPDSYFSNNLTPTGIIEVINKERADIIHLHVFPEMISIQEISKINASVVITLRDFWPMTGGCHFPLRCKHYATKCGNCPLLHSSKIADQSYKIWLQKKTFWTPQKISFVAPSKWMAACAQHSSLLRNYQITVIPNAVDTSIFKPAHKLGARQHLGLDMNKPIILCGSENIQHQHKGLIPFFDQLIKHPSLKKVEIVVFGNNIPNPKRYPFRFVGKIIDRNVMAELYSAADIYCTPSYAEPFGLTMAEALSCGTPVAAFNNGGARDIVTHSINGLLIDNHNYAQLANETIRFARRNYRQRRGITALKKFSIEATAREYLKLYEKRCSSKQPF